MIKSIYIKIKKYYIAYKRLKAIRITKHILESIPNKQLSHHRLNFYLFQLELEYIQQTHIPIVENLKKKYPRTTELLTKHFYLIILILYTLKGITTLLIGYLLYSK